MANEIFIHAVVIEQEDGTYKSYCPDLDLTAKGATSDEALRNIKEAAIKSMKEDGKQLNSVKCLKVKIPV